MKKLTLSVVVVIALFSTNIALAGAPFNNLEGVGGVAFNPLAYPGGSGEVAKYIGKPQFGVWYVNLNQVDVNWFAAGISDTLFDKLELSYGYETVGQQDARTHYKHNIGAKLLLLPENFQDLKFLPAVSIGGIYKNTDNVIAGANKDGWDTYLVASKLITQLPLPILVSGGLLLTSSYATGVFGYDSALKPTFFGNLDGVLSEHFIIGIEYKQGPHFDAFKNADYWDAHLTYTVNKNLTLIAAYVNAGDYKSTDKVGLGDGVVLSTQYAF